MVLSMLWARSRHLALSSGLARSTRFGALGHHRLAPIAWCSLGPWLALSLARLGALVSRGSLMDIGAIQRAGSLVLDGTLRASGSLYAEGALGYIGSLGQHGALNAWLARTGWCSRRTWLAPPIWCPLSTARSYSLVLSPVLSRATFRQTCQRFIQLRNNYRRSRRGGFLGCLSAWSRSRH